MARFNRKRHRFLSFWVMPPAIINVIVYVVVFRICTLFLNCLCSPLELSNELRVLRAPFVWWFVVNLLFILYLAVDAISFPWKETYNRRATVYAYVVAGILLLAIQYVLWQHLWPSWPFFDDEILRRWAEYYSSMSR